MCGKQMVTLYKVDSNNTEVIAFFKKDLSKEINPLDLEKDLSLDLFGSI